MIEARHLRKNYGETEALRGVDFRIERGEVVGLLGPNGAGKTTAMKIIVGYLLPTSGTAIVAGYDVTENPLAVQERIGYLPENAPLYSDMLVREHLRFMADMRGLDAATARRRMSQAAGDCGIDDVLHRPIGQLSKGYRQRVGLAGTILHDPEILILDEPTTGLDPNQIVEVRELIRRMGETKTVILSTHILPEVEITCGRAIMMIDGVIRADGSLEQLTRAHAQVVTISTPDPAEASAIFENVPGVHSVELQHSLDGVHTFRLELVEGSEVGEAISEVAQSKRWPLRELRRDDRTLEQVFRELTQAGDEVPV